MATACSTPTATQPFPGACEPLHVLSWTPVNGALDVPRDTIISLTLDAYPEPHTVGLASVIITTGVFYHPGIFGIDMIDKAITFAAAGNLRPDLGYTITVRPALTSLQGCPAVEEQHLFHTSATTALPPPAPAVAVPFAAVQPIFARTCGGATCHRASLADGGATDGGPADAGASEPMAGGCLSVPAAGLSLCDRDAVTALVGVPSIEVRRLHLVEPNDSARSYLLRKLLPGDTPDRPAPTTLGHRDPPGAPLPVDELRAIARWIDTGANP